MKYLVRGICIVIILSMISCDQSLQPEECVGIYQAYRRPNEHSYIKWKIDVSVEEEFLHMKLLYYNLNGSILEELRDDIKLDQDVNLNDSIYIDTGKDYTYRHEFVFGEDLIKWRFVLTSLPDNIDDSTHVYQELEDVEFWELEKIDPGYNY